MPKDGLMNKYFVVVTDKFTYSIGDSLIEAMHNAKQSKNCECMVYAIPKCLAKEPYVTSTGGVGWDWKRPALELEEEVREILMDAFCIGQFTVRQGKFKPSH